MTSWKFQLICNFSLFLLLFMDLTTLFSTINRFHCTIQLTFTFIYSTFNKKFSVSVKLIVPKRTPSWTFELVPSCISHTMGLFGWKKMVTHHSLLNFHHSISHFLSPNNEEISHLVRLALNTQLCFQPKKLKKLGPTHFDLTCALDPPTRPY